MTVVTAASTPSPRSNGAIVAAVLIGVFVVGATVTIQTLGWGVDQLLILLGLGMSWLVGPATSLVNAGLLAVPVLLLARIPRSPAVRAVGQVWTIGVVALAVLGSVRALPPTQPELLLALQAALALLLGWLFRPRGLPRHRPSPGTYAGAVITGGAVLLPWLWFGALGGMAETLLAVAAAAAVGRFAAVALSGRFWPHVATSRTRLVVVGGLVAGVTLLLVAAGTGGSGAQLPLMLLFPPLGFAAAALSPCGQPSADGGDVAGPCPALWVLFAIALMGPLAFLDPEEVTLLLDARDVPFWAGVAALCGLLVALLLGLAWTFGRRVLTSRPGWAWGLTVVVVVAGTATHIGWGQPGFHGERLFVIMADQADLTGLPSGAGQAGRDARATEVYRRLVTHAERSQADLRADLERLRLSYRPYYLVNAVEVQGGPAVRAWLSTRDDVDRVLVSQRLRPLPAPIDVDSGTPGLTPEEREWNLTAIRADQVWSRFGVTGEGIVVGSSDSGVDAAHPALADGFRGGPYSWFDPWNGTDAPTDSAGHGTHTLGSAVGRGGIGVAPGAEWTACVNLYRNGGNPAYYLDCLQFMLAPFPPGGDPWRDGRPELAPHVLTNSWGCTRNEGCDLDALRPATAALAAAGIYVVVAAGNTGPFCGSVQDPPAPYQDVLTVGAVTRDNHVASFSSRGPTPDGVAKPDLVAPGVGVVSAMPGGGYAKLSGTSMATPHVAGVVALMWSANPDLIGDVATTTEILRSTAEPLDVAEGVCSGSGSLVGAGLINAEAAVEAALDR